jgi:hypothetical protein
VRGTGSSWASISGHRKTVDCYLGCQTLSLKKNMADSDTIHLTDDMLPLCADVRDTRLHARLASSGLKIYTS